MDMKLPIALLAIALLIFSFSCGDDEYLSGGYTEQASTADSKMMVASAPSMSNSPLSTAQIERHIIRSANAEIVVDDVEGVFETIIELVDLKSGYVESSSIGSGRGYHPFDESPTDRLTANITARIPSNYLEQLLEEIGDMAVGQPYLMVSSRDVTSEYTDTEITLENLRAVEKRFRSLLDDARSVSEIIEVQDRLNQTRLEIDRYTRRLKYLESQVAMSQLNVTIYGEVPEEHNSLLEVISVAWGASIETINMVFRTILSVVVFSWWIILVVCPLIYFINKKIRSN
jgi:hypothetical protein